MDNNLSKESVTKFIVLGVYQIVGGVFGLILTILLITKLSAFPLLLSLILLIALVLYTYSIYCGVLLIRKKISGIRLSIINQCLQLISFTFVGFSFQYFSGIYFLIGVDLTDSFILNFSFGFSSWQININSDPKPLIFSFNFVSFFILLFILRFKRIIRVEILQDQLTNLGQ